MKNILQCLASMTTQAADSLLDMYFQTTNTCKFPSYLHWLKNQFSHKMSEIPAMLESNSPHPVFPYYLLPLLQHLSVINRSSPQGENVSSIKGQLTMETEWV